MIWAWVMNADQERVDEWKAKGDLPGFVFGIKHVMQVKWHTDVIIEGNPKRTDWQSATELADQGVIGLYARRRTQ